MRQVASRIAGSIARRYERFSLAFRYEALADADKIVRVPISDIAYRIEDIPLLSRATPGIVVSSYPDLETFARFLARDKKYMAVVEHFARGTPWRETELFTVQYARRLKKEPVRGFHTLDELERFYCERYDRLYDEIRRNGIDWRRFGRGVTPLYVHISEHGTFIWPSEGNHRLAICSVLGHTTLPCQIYSRHQAWQERREEMLADLRSGRPVERWLLAHPDMQDIVEGFQVTVPAEAEVEAVTSRRAAA